MGPVRQILLFPYQITLELLLLLLHPFAALQSCVAYAAASPERLTAILTTPGYLHLNEASPRVGSMFVAAAMQRVMRGVGGS